MLERGWSGGEEEATAGNSARPPLVRSARTILKVIGPTLPRGVSPTHSDRVQDASGEIELWFSVVQFHVDVAWAAA